jgi:hypothetical protein
MTSRTQPLECRLLKGGIARIPALDLLQEMRAAEPRQKLGKNKQRNDSMKSRDVAPKVAEEKTQWGHGQKPTHWKFLFAIHVLAVHVHPPKHLASAVDPYGPTGTEAAIS